MANAKWDPVDSFILRINEETGCRHFWDVDEAAAFKIAKVGQKGPGYTLEDVIWHAWVAIAAPYFPTRSVPGGRRYSIEREPYRGLPPMDPYGQRPDVVVIRLQNFQQQQQGMLPTTTERDILWIECKAPNLDVPGGWKRVMNEAAGRLRVAHPTRRVYLILAIGLKWMPFVWDPVAPTLNPAGSPLQILKDNQREVWAVDPGMYMIAPANLPGQRHVQQQQNGALIVDSRSAYSLDYWTLDGNGNPANMHDMLLLENFFALIQATQYQGSNPPEF